MTLRAIEQWSSVRSQSGIARIRLSCSMTLRLKPADKTNPKQKVTFWPSDIPKSSNSHYFSGFITPIFLTNCGQETPKNTVSEPNPK
jgi:hypothetical protein